MRLGGVDPSILRELSGVYKPFVKAFKELISNAFDADAATVAVQFAPDFSAVTVTDDGSGMTPFDFRDDFTRLGGGSRRWNGDRTRGGRLRIGSKGIGFLALARYCDRLRVESSADRTFTKTICIADAPRSVDLAQVLGVPVPPLILSRRVTCTVTRGGGKRPSLREGRQFKVDGKTARLTFSEKPGDVDLRLNVDCRGLAFTATLDFERLLQLADAADLEHLSDFASIDVAEVDANHRDTRITAERLKPFVRRGLRLDRRKGFVRNIGSRSGMEQFTWQLSRCTPVPYAPPPQGYGGPTLLANVPEDGLLTALTVKHGPASLSIRRPIYAHESHALELFPDMHVPVHIDEGGLSANGFITGYEGVIFPAEYRGISIRVRGVAIGDPSFLGTEHLLTGADKAALSQITGEIVVLQGLDAVDTLNPGRESFYEESEQYKTLRRHVIGDGEHVRGALGRAIEAVLRRSQVRSSLSDVLGRAAIRRRTLEDVSAAVTHLLGRQDDTAAAVRRMLRSKAAHTNGLASAPEQELAMPPRIGGLAVIPAAHLHESAVVDFVGAQVQVDTARPEWSWRLLLHDRPFEVLHRRGKPHDPIAEMDFKADRIYVNWGHSIKQQMDERSFLRFALAWVLASQVGCLNPGQMMTLALQLLSFTTESNA